MRVPHPLRTGVCLEGIIITRARQRGGDRDLEFSVGDGIAAVGDRKAPSTLVYHPGTGEILKHNEVLLRPGRTWYRFHNPTY